MRPNVARRAQIGVLRAFLEFLWLGSERSDPPQVKLGNLHGADEALGCRYYSKIGMIREGQAPAAATRAMNSRCSVLSVTMIDQGANGPVANFSWSVYFMNTLAQPKRS